MHVPTQCCLPSNSFFLPLTHACLLLSPPGIFLLNNQFLSRLMWLKHTQRHARAYTDADLRLDQYPSLFCWRRHWHHFWPWAKHTLILQKKERETERGRENGAQAGREKEGRCSGSQVARWPAACAFSILLPRLPELWASCGPLGWSSHLSFSSSSSHLSCTSPSYGCRGSWSHSEAWWEQDKELVRRRKGFTWAVDINILGGRNRLKIILDFGVSISSFR